MQILLSPRFRGTPTPPRQVETITADDPRFIPGAALKNASKLIHTTKRGYKTKAIEGCNNAVFTLEVKGPGTYQLSATVANTPETTYTIRPTVKGDYYFVSVVTAGSSYPAPPEAYAIAKTFLALVAKSDIERTIG